MIEEQEYGIDTADISRSIEQLDAQSERVDSFIEEESRFFFQWCPAIRFAEAMVYDDCL